MKKLLLLLTLILVIFIVLHRQRLFLRDPIASVTRDGQKVANVVVMINYTNDILLQDASTPTKRLYLVQNWNHLAAAPTAPIKCLQGFACLTDADQATAAPIPVGSRGRREPFQGVTMTNRHIEFVDEDGALVAVTLR